MNSRNVIFLMLDTVRADVLRLYGGDARMPFTEGVARNGTTYNMAISPGTYTLPSHLSLFLGKRVRSIPGMRTVGMKFSDSMTDPFMKKSRYGRGEITLAACMEYFGYRSALFSNNPYVSGPTGLADGFSYVNNIFIDKKIKSNRIEVRTLLNLIQNDISRKGLIRLATAVSRILPDSTLDATYLRLRKKLNRHFSEEYGYYELDKGAADTNAELRRYLRHNDSDRNFIFVNYMEGHEGYPTNLFKDGYVEQDKWLHMTGRADEVDLGITLRAYKKRIEYLDSKLRDAMGIMKESGLLDDATVIISSDHGQAFMEHGQMFHNVMPYNEVSRVPLVVAEFRSGRQVKAKKVVEQQFSLTRLNRLISGGRDRSDNVPVVSDHTGITEVWDSYLLRIIRGRSKNADAIYRKKLELDRPSTAIFSGGYKLMHNYGRRKDELYDMGADIHESDNIIDRKRGIAHRLVALNSAV